MTHQWRLFRIALQFFTRIPVGEIKDFRSEWLTQSARYFSLVGIVVGCFSAAVLWLASQALPLPIAVLLSIAASLWLTGAFHEDGLADTFDGLGGHVSKERALEIMKDSRIGTYGMVALVIVLLLRWQLLSSMSLKWACVACVLSHCMARGMSASIMASLSYVREDLLAKAKPLAQDLRGASLWIVLIISLLPVAMISFMDKTFIALGVLLIIALLLTRWCCVVWFRKRLHGFTGDTLGCAEQLGEVTVLAVISMWLHLGLMHSANALYGG
jgi:adenosylcobinamide-GDP ribazoletransferase